MTKNDGFTFSVGIVTFDKRFDQYFKPLINQIKKHYPNLEVQVCVNGPYLGELDEQYRKSVLEFCSQHPKVYPMVWTDFRALSKMWNMVICNSTTNNVLVLNDDLVINPTVFLEDVQTAINKHGGRTIKLNNSWSHFVANREEIAEIGWFDERLLGVGNEDGDMQLRFEQKYGESFPNANVNGVHNCIDGNGVLEGIKKMCGKYTRFNDIFFKEKWRVDELTEEEQKEYWANRDKIPILEFQPNALPYEKFWWLNKSKLGEKK